MSKVILSNCSIGKYFNITTVNQIKVINQNSSFNMTYNGNNSFLNKNILELDQHFNQIEVTSSTIIRLLENSSCNSLSIISSATPSIYFIGDISKIKTINITGSCNIFTLINTHPLNWGPEINIIMPSNESNTKIYINGNFVNSTIFLRSPTKLILDGNFNTLLVPQVDTTNFQYAYIEINLNTTLKEINTNSNLFLTAPKAFFDKINVPDGVNISGLGKIIEDKIRYKIPFTNNIGTQILNLDTPGVYTISAYISLNNTPFHIGTKTITVTDT